MSLVVFATQYTPPNPAGYIDPYPGLTLTWTGADGSVWDLCDKDSGLSLIGDVEGMHTPEFADYIQEFADLDGQEYGGGTAKARSVEWPVLIWSDTSAAEWLARETAWWRSFKPRGATGTWSVQSPDGSVRTLRCRLTSDGGYAHSNDPSRFGWAQYSISLVADDPWWYGTPITGRWQTAAPLLFFGGGDPTSPTDVADQAGPPFVPSQSSTVANAELLNPGDEPAFGEWTITGPVTAGTITVAGGSIGIPAVPAGSTLVINTSPDDPNAFLDGVEVSGLIDPWDDTSFPPGETTSVTLDLTADPGAAIEVAAPTKYWRAYA